MTIGVHLWAIKSSRRRAGKAGPNSCDFDWDDFINAALTRSDDDNIIDCLQGGGAQTRSPCRLHRLQSQPASLSCAERLPRQRIREPTSPDGRVGASAAMLWATRR